MTRRLRRARRLGLAVAAAALVGVFGWFFREPLLAGAGAFLVRQDAPAKADIIVVVRGDEVFLDRTLKAAELFKAGLAPNIYVSSALDDEAASRLHDRGISLDSGQERIVYVLAQAGVPCAHIVVDSAASGGGTAGEMRRVRTFVKSRGAASVILVTSWFHSRRVGMIAASTLADVSVLVVAADSVATERNWWHHRFLAVTVVEEYFKLLLQTLAIAPRFDDDPRSGTAAYLQPPPSCRAGSRA
jgi:uncharacterized SAM-binding protein YcdF (DUF218 family)